MLKKNKLIIVFILVVLIVSFFGYQYIYQDHRNISSEKASFELTANDIEKEYKNNPTSANEKFLDKTVVIIGVVTSVDEENKSIVLNEKINCNFKSDIDLKVSNVVSVKGRFIGYDELLEEYNLDECSRIK